MNKTDISDHIDYSSEVPTVNIQGKDGPVRINASEFNESKGHKLHKPTKKEEKENAPQFTDKEIGEQAAKKAAAQLKPANVLKNPQVPSRGVVHNGKKGKKAGFIIVNSANVPVDDEVYPTEKAAWDVALTQAQPENSEAAQQELRDNIANSDSDEE